MQTEANLTVYVLAIILSYREFINSTRRVLDSKMIVICFKYNGDTEMVNDIIQQRRNEGGWHVTGEQVHICVSLG